LLETPVHAMARTKQCVIRVGGALTRDKPKPMIDVAGRPFIEYLLHEVGRHGFRRVVLLAGRQAERLIARFPRHCRISPDIELEITHIVEPEPAGTAGALLHAAAALDEEFLLLKGGSLFDINLLDLLCRPAAGPWLAKIALRQIPDATRHATVTLDEAGIVRFAEPPGRSGPATIDGGVYWLNREILQAIGRSPCSLEADIFPALAQRGVCFGQAYSGFFIDIGTPEDLARAQHCLRARMTRGAAFLDRDGVLNIDDGYVHLPKQFKWVGGAKEAIKSLNDRGFFVFVATNQAGVARGYYSEAHVRALHDWINEQLMECGAHVDAFRYCPFHPQSGIGDYRRVSDLRKPDPGMLQDLITHWPVRIEQSFLIGDKASDLEAARRAGLAGHLFEGGADLRGFVERVSAGLTPWPASSL
jgi:D,D-heptose 1,7-bisphosphate phosphatase